MIRVAHKAFADADVTISPSRISRLVRRCLDRAKRHDVPFRDSLAELANLSSSQRRRVFADPDLARCIAYADTTGEEASHNACRVDPDGSRSRARAAHRP
jgi:hypothetical protein